MRYHRAVTTRPEPSIAKAEKANGPIVTVVLWSVLIAMYVGIYWMMAKNPTATGAAKLVGVMLAVLVAIVFVTAFVSVRRNRRAVGELNRGTEMLAHGQLNEALEIFRRWSEQKTAPWIAANSRHNASWTLMRQGKVSEAIELGLDNVQTL
jgi:hypothetical protein